jgi:hypothetical protein
MYKITFNDLYEKEIVVLKNNLNDRIQDSENSKDTANTDNNYNMNNSLTYNVMFGCRINGVFRYLSPKLV